MDSFVRGGWAQANKLYKYHSKLLNLRARNKSDTEYSQQFAEIDWGIGMHDSDILKCFLM